jgi:hypothetical protein
LRKHPDLLSEVLSVFATYNERVAADKANRIAVVENNPDNLIEAARVERAKLSSIENAQLEAARNHARVESILTNRANERNSIVWAIEQSVGLVTRAEQADRREQIAKAEYLVEMAQQDEIQAFSGVQFAKGDRDRAYAAWQAAEGKAKECKAELDILMGRKAEYSQSGLAMR